MGVGTGTGTGKSGDVQHSDALSLAEFGALMDECQRPLHAFLLRLLRDDEAACDVMQDTFCAAWQQMQRAKGPFAAGAPEKARTRPALFLSPGKNTTSPPARPPPLPSAPPGRRGAQPHAQSSPRPP